MTRRRILRRPGQRAHAPLPRFVRAALLLLRALAVLLALNLSGALHLALDLWLEGEAAAQHFSGASDDGDDGCPPGCTSCHCTHASPALPEPVGAIAPLELLPAFEIAWSPYESGAPPPRAPLSVYRPPRA